MKQLCSLLAGSTPCGIPAPAGIQNIGGVPGGLPPACRPGTQEQAQSGLNSCFPRNDTILFLQTAKCYKNSGEHSHQGARELISNSGGEPIRFFDGSIFAVRTSSPPPGGQNPACYSRASGNPESIFEFPLASQEHRSSHKGAGIPASAGMTHVAASFG